MILELPTTLVELKKLTKRFGKVTVVDEIDLTIPRGQVFGLLGPNGAGKSTTLKMLMGLLPATGGSAHLLGLDVSSNKSRKILRQQVGYVPELHHMYPWMTVRRLLNFAGSFYLRWNHQRMDSLLKLFRLDRNKKIKHLSKGMQTKLAMVVALSHEPDLLILDEPMSGLDPLVREEILEGILDTVVGRDHTVIFSSHNIDDVSRISDSIGLLYEGSMLVQSSVDSLLKATKRIRAVLDDGCQPTWAPNSAIWQNVREREWQITVGDFSPEMVMKLRNENSVQQVDVFDMNLEDVFKDYVKGRRGAA